ncbi:MAG: hypothetical protein ACLQD8_01975 [Thermoplasmata archaeon]
MSAPLRADLSGGGAAAALLFGTTAGALGLLTGLPLPIGSVLGVAGVGASVAWRRASSARASPGFLLPGLLAISILVIAAPPGPSAELLAGVGGLVLLLWLAADPGRPTGGERRAAPALSLAALAVVLAWLIAFLGPRGAPDVGIAGGLLAIGVVLLAVLFARSRTRAWRAPGAT